MSEPANSILAAIGFIFMVGLSGAAFAFGVGQMCRWMKWAPVNMTVNVKNYGEATGFSDDR